MLRIETASDGCVTRLLLSGRIRPDGIVCIRLAMKNGCARKVLDLSEVTLVDIAAIHFLMRCENEGVELANCPPYVREWIHRERAERAQGGVKV
jgi:hypothetical protein